MRSSERAYAYMYIQLITLLSLTVYTYLQYNGNLALLIWYGLALVTALLGYTRQMPIALFFALLFTLSYGAVTLYFVFGSQTVAELDWHHILWLFLYPFVAIICGLNREERLPRLAGFFHESDTGHKAVPAMPPLSTTELAVRFGFSSLTRHEFLEQTEAVVNKGLQEKYTFTLLLIDIKHFPHFHAAYGPEQSVHLLHKVAEMIVETMPTLTLRAYFGDGRFAILLPWETSLRADTAQLRLNQLFESMLLTRARSDGYIRVSLKYGIADFPLHGLHAQRLLEHAEQQFKLTEEEEAT